jgi:hypothetical protein
VGLAERPQPRAALPSALQRRVRAFRRARLAVLALVVGYFFLPYEARVWIPVWLVFLAAVGLEVHFFVGGYLQARRGSGGTPARDHGPQPRDLADLGGEHWQETLAVEHAGERHFVPVTGLIEEEVPERVEEYLRDPEAVLERARGEPPPPRASPLRYRRYVLEAVAAVALVAGILAWATRPHGWDAVAQADRARAEALFSRQAALVAGHPARVECDTSGRYVGFVQDADGLAVVGGAQAYLTPEICDALYQLAFKGRVQSFPRTGRAIAVLAHEAWHLQGVRDEGLASCYAFQSGVRIGVALGLEEGTARAMMRAQLATNASDAGANLRYRVPAGCRDGGEHDLRPAARDFP